MPVTKYFKINDARTESIEKYIHAFPMPKAVTTVLIAVSVTSPTLPTLLNNNNNTHETYVKANKFFDKLIE